MDIHQTLYLIRVECKLYYPATRENWAISFIFNQSGM